MDSSAICFACGLRSVKPFAVAERAARECSSGAGSYLARAFWLDSAASDARLAIPHWKGRTGSFSHC